MWPIVDISKGQTQFRGSDAFESTGRGRAGRTRATARAATASDSARAILVELATRRRRTKALSGTVATDVGAGRTGGGGVCSLHPWFCGRLWGDLCRGSHLSLVGAKSRGVSRARTGGGMGPSIAGSYSTAIVVVVILGRQEVEWDLTGIRMSGRSLQGLRG